MCGSSDSVCIEKFIYSQRRLKRTLISVGLFLGVVLISYIFADSSDVKANGIVYSGATSKWVSAGLNAFYLLAVVAVGAMVWTGFNKIKK